MHQKFRLNKKIGIVFCGIIFLLLTGTLLADDGQVADINGVKLFYKTFGDPATPPVLVLHGGLSRIESMHNQIDALSERFFVVAPDSRGHGRSTAGDVPISYRLMMDDALALLDQLKIQRADVVGWSDGGIIGLYMAVEKPDRLNRLVAISANFDTSGIGNEEFNPDGAMFAPAREAYLKVSPTPDRWPVFFADVTRMWKSEPNFTIAQIQSIKAPTLVLAGENDSIKREHTEALAEAIPHAKLSIIGDAGHLLVLEKPDAVNSAILEFLK